MKTNYKLRVTVLFEAIMHLAYNDDGKNYSALNNNSGIFKSYGDYINCKEFKKY